MPSSWIDLLSLHGYITDIKLLRKLATRPPAPAPREHDGESRLLLMAKRMASSTRLCLGIGDGVLRSQ